MSSEEPTMHPYNKSFLLFTHIILGAILAFFTISWTLEYSHNLTSGYFTSALVLITYLFVIYKSAKLFTQRSVGAAYFLTISGFIALAFIEIIGCSNSLKWLH
jgi:hypothetical protein